VLGLGPATRVYLAVGATDLRKGFEGLFGLVKDRLELEPLSGHVVCFCNRSRSRIKLLFWDGYATLAIMGRCDVDGAFLGKREGQTVIAILIILLPSSQKLEGRVAVGVRGIMESC
jgi:transposase